MDIDQESKSIIEPILDQSIDRQSLNLENNIPDEKRKVNFDVILNRIGFGFYHIKVWCIFAFLGMADGAESIVLSFIIPVFEQVFAGEYDFNLTTTLGTFVYIGFFVGSIFSGFTSDKFGRKKPVVFATIFMIIFCLISAYPTGLIFFIVFRSLFGMVDGFFSPFSFTYMAEMTPAKHRGKYVSILSINYIIGEIVTCLIAIFTLNSFTEGNWHALLVWSTLPGVFAFISSAFFLEESARYEMIQGRYENGVSLLKKIWKMNRKTEEPLMTNEEEKELINTYEERKKKKGDEKPQEVSMKEVFTPKYRRITLLSWFNWFVNTFTYNGLTYILPSVLQSLNRKKDTEILGTSDFDVGSVIYSCLSEIPTVIIATSIVDTKLFGRKNSMAINFFLGGIFCLLASYQIYPGLVFWISASKSFFSMAWNLNYQFTSELYPTVIRGRGLGLASSVGKFGCVIMPVLCSLLFEVGTLIPFMMFGVISLVACVCTLALPYDTAGVNVDDIDKDQ